MSLVVVTDLPRDVEDAMRYAANKSQQQQHFRQSHALVLIRPNYNRFSSQFHHLPPQRLDGFAVVGGEENLPTLAAGF